MKNYCHQSEHKESQVMPSHWLLGPDQGRYTTLTREYGRGKAVEVSTYNTLSPEFNWAITYRCNCSKHSDDCQTQSQLYHFKKTLVEMFLFAFLWQIKSWQHSFPWHFYFWFLWFAIYLLWHGWTNFDSAKTQIAPWGTMYLRKVKMEVLFQKRFSKTRNFS